ncbi:MAG: TonB-dependent receptor [Gammaproteobacteria bacterium]|nr:TonB-dependent receptor [Gammaproteobacteria bacterium]
MSQRQQPLLAAVLLNGILLMISSSLHAADKQTPIEQKLRDYERRISQLEKRQQTTTNTNSSSLQIGLSGLFSAGASNADNKELAKLQGGGHDPNKNGFTVQNVELSLSGTVDPMFDAQANIIMLIDAEGETVVELEEAFFLTRAMPGGLQLKGGQYYTEFGRRNVQHPHTWSFADQPVILSRLFGGDGLRSQGVRLAWLMPTNWYSEFYLGMQNAKGETVSSFLSAEGEEVGGHTLIAREARGSGDLLYSARWLNGFDLSDNLSMNLGLSGLRGPNASGYTTETQIYGADLYLKWQGTGARGFPFVAWHTEYLQREYEAADPWQANHETLRDKGMFSQITWGFTPGWVLGLRYETASASGDTSTDPLRDNRSRISPNITWYPSEYSKIRLQYNRDKAEHFKEDTAQSLWLQVEFSLGSHMAHTF